MVTSIRRTGERGLRTPRNLDTYQEKGGVKGAGYCECGAVFRNKRWFREEIGSETQEGHELVCPACRRIADNNPAGIVSLSGDYFDVHETEIHNLINNTAQGAVTKNPLGRVIDISRDKVGVTITTTDVKLAQKIGRDVYKSHSGHLQFVWSNAESPVRVIWSR